GRGNRPGRKIFDVACATVHVSSFVAWLLGRSRAAVNRPIVLPPWERPMAIASTSRCLQASVVDVGSPPVLSPYGLLVSILRSTRTQSTHLRIISSHHVAERLR